MRSVWEPPWAWIAPLSFRLARTWGLLSSRLPGALGAVLAVPLGLLLWPNLAAARALRTVAAISPKASLQAVPIMPTSATLKHQLAVLGLWLLFIIPAAIVVLVASLALALVDLLALGGDGNLYEVLFVLLGVAVVIGLVDGIGMLAGITEIGGIGKLLKQRYAGRSVTQLSALGAWPRGHGHGSALLDACAADLRRHPPSEVIFAGALDDAMGRRYVAYGLTQLTTETGEPARRAYVAELSAPTNRPG